MGGHRQGRPGGRQDRGLRRRGRRAQHRQDDQLAEGAAQDLVAEYGEHVTLVVGIDERGDAAEGEAGHGHQREDREQDDGRQDSGPPRGALGVAGLLVARDRAVPAPVDEDREQDAGGQGTEGGDLERVEPTQRRVHRAFRGVAGVDLDQGDDREQGEGHKFDGEQQELQPGRHLDAPVADIGQQDDPRAADQRRPERARRKAVGAEEQKRVLPGDLREVGHHDDVGDDDAPAAHPPGPRPEGPRRPGERGAAVGVDGVELPVGVRDTEHRHERQQHHRRRLQPHRGGDEADRGGQAVARRGRGDPNHDTRQQPQSARLEALVLSEGLRNRHGDSFDLRGVCDVSRRPKATWQGFPRSRHRSDAKSRASAACAADGLAAG